MKKNYTLLFFLFSLFACAQGKLVFNYDNAGNQVLRTFCINCVSKNSNDTKESIPEDVQSLDDISYFPNPVLQELNLSWELKEEKRVAEIQLFSLSGAQLKNLSVGNNNQVVIAFDSYPSGVYMVYIVYNTGEQKTIKIIKK